MPGRLELSFLAPPFVLVPVFSSGVSSALGAFAPFVFGLTTLKGGIMASLVVLDGGPKEVPMGCAPQNANHILTYFGINIILLVERVCFSLLPPERFFGYPMLVLEDTRICQAFIRRVQPSLCCRIRTTCISIVLAVSEGRSCKLGLRNPDFLPFCIVCRFLRRRRSRSSNDTC